MEKHYFILLPPSESKAPGGQGEAWIRKQNTFDGLDAPRRQLIAILQDALYEKQVDPAKLLGVKGAALEAALQANLTLNQAPTLPAIERYTGVMFQALDYASLDPALQARFDEHVIFFSGLWGLLAPRDRIPDYKLKMDGTLPSLGRLSTWWRPHLSPLLNRHVAGAMVWDLLPTAHAAAWEPARERLAGHVTVRFVRETLKGGKRVRQTVSHWSKALKGALIRFILERALTDPAGLVDFHHPEGYRYSPAESTIEGGSGSALFVRPLD